LFTEPCLNSAAPSWPFSSETYVKNVAIEDLEKFKVPK
jgi:hypothetical protein